MTPKKRAKILAGLALAPDGSVDAERAMAVCEYAGSHMPEGVRGRVLREIRRILALKIMRDSAVVSHAGGLSDSAAGALAEFVRGVNPSAKIEFREDAGLIAGVSVAVGDMRWENSVRARLEGLSSPSANF